MKQNRIQLMDALRGLAVLLMVVHHFLYDLCAFCGAPWWLFTNPVFDVLHYIFAGVFILLSGVSSNFSRSNVKRGLKALGVAVVITVVTVWMHMDIWFGVLHLLAVCMLFYGLTRKFWEKLPRWVVPVFTVAGTVLTGSLAEGRFTDIPHLWMFGWITPDFYSSDYFPLLPWSFVFLFGTWTSTPPTTSPCCPGALSSSSVPGWGGVSRRGNFPVGFMRPRSPAWRRWAATAW